MILGLYADGDYQCVCKVCGKTFIGDKRAQSCLDCAVARVNEQKRQLLNIIDKYSCHSMSCTKWSAFGRSTGCTCGLDEAMEPYRK